MTDKDIETFILINEPVFYFAGKQYSICCVDGVFGTWDSDGNEMDFSDIEDLLDNWEIEGVPFRQIVGQIM